MKGVDIGVDIEVDIYIDNIDRTGKGTRDRGTLKYSPNVLEVSYHGANTVTFFGCL
jgi:hypothetical protein